MRLRLLLLAGVIAATAFLIVGVALGEADWQACLERSLSRAFPNSQSSSAQPTAAWTVALRALMSPSGDALLIVATVLPTLVAVVLARRPSQQAIALVPMALPVGLALLAWGDMHDCDRKGCNACLAIGILLLLFQLPIGTALSFGLGLGRLWTLLYGRSTQ